MNYKNRLLERKILRCKEVFPVILVIGARQVGKSTLLSHLFGAEGEVLLFQYCQPAQVCDPDAAIGIGFRRHRKTS